MSQPKQKGMGGIQQIWHARQNPPKDPDASFVGKTVLVTGANSGLVSEYSVLLL
jgi:hypothetical protein